MPWDNEMKAEHGTEQERNRINKYLFLSCPFTVIVPIDKEVY